MQKILELAKIVFFGIYYDLYLYLSLVYVKIVKA